MAARSDTEIVGDYTYYSATTGKGTFGPVNEAIHNKSHKKFSAKRIQVHYKGKNNENNYAIAKRELQNITDQNKHVNVVSLRDFSFKRNNCYLVMDHFEDNLGDFLVQNQNITYNQKLQYMLQSTSAVVFMHNQTPPVVHGELQLKNIYVQKQDHSHIIKIADFGLSNIFDAYFSISLSELYTNTAATTDYGLHYFKAPEFFKTAKRVSKYDTFEDIFSLGLVFAVILVNDTGNLLKPLSGIYDTFYMHD